MAKKWAVIIGIVLIVVGLVAFIPNPIVGDGSYFDTNAFHNLFHIVTGIIFIIAGTKSESASSTTFIVFGVIYVILTILGFLIGDGLLLGLVKIGGGDNILHLLLTIVFLAIGFGTKPKGVQA